MPHLWKLLSFTCVSLLSQWIRGRKIPPVVHLPQLRSHPHFPHAHQSFTSAAHNLPVISLNCSDTEVVGVQGGHGGAGSQVKHPHPEPQQRWQIMLLASWEVCCLVIWFQLGRSVEKMMHYVFKSRRLLLVISESTTVMQLRGSLIFPNSEWSEYNSISHFQWSMVILDFISCLQRRRTPRLHSLSKSAFICRQKDTIFTTGGTFQHRAKRPKINTNWSTWAKASSSLICPRLNTNIMLLHLVLSDNRLYLQLLPKMGPVKTIHFNILIKRRYKVLQTDRNQWNMKLLLQ